MLGGGRAESKASSKHSRPILKQAGPVPTSVIAMEEAISTAQCKEKDHDESI